MKIALFVAILLGILFILWLAWRLFRKLSLTDKLTVIRHGLLEIYGFLLSPYLLLHLPKILAIGIMFLFVLTLTFVFVVILGAKKEKSIFIQPVNWFWKMVFSLFRIIIIHLILSLDGKVQKKTIIWLIGLKEVDKRPFVTGSLAVIEPFLSSITYRDNYCSSRKVLNKKILRFMVLTNLLAALTWTFITLNSVVILKFYFFLGYLWSHFWGFFMSLIA